MSDSEGYPQNPGFFSRLGRGIMAVILSPFRALRFLCLVIGFTVLATAAGAGAYTYYFYRSLPDFRGVPFDRLRQQASAVIGQRREDKARGVSWTPIGGISRDYLYAIVMSEDSGFFEHGAIDYDAMLNALAVNLKKRRYEFGASTISQQVAKNLFLTSEKSLVRKARELFITERLERIYSKNEILELYLNLAEFGRDIFGVAEAARHYFDKVPSEINAAEGAFIAIMLPSPRRNEYAVYENRNLSEPRRRKIRRILGDLLANDYISPAQYHSYSRYDFFGSGRMPAGRPVGGLTPGGSTR